MYEAIAGLTATYCVLECIKTRKIKKFMDEVHNIEKKGYKIPAICIAKLICIIAITILLIINRLNNDVLVKSGSVKSTIAFYLLMLILIAFSIKDVIQSVKENTDKEEEKNEEEEINQ